MRSRALAWLVLLLPWPGSSLASIEIFNSGADASLGFEIQGHFVAIRTSEARAGGTDLNGDGDTTDFVLQVIDLRTGAVRNTGLEASGGFRMAGRYIAFTVLESRQGGRDLNGDGDTSDLVLHVYDAETGTAINLELAAGSFRIDGELVTFTVIESAQGGVDRNGDGDARDGVLHVYDISRGALMNVGRDAAAGFSVSGTHVAFASSEANQGNTDLNGDGDAFDTVLHLFDASTGKVTNLGLATLSNQFQLDENLLAFTVREALQGNTDLNGDSDAGDNVLHLHDASSGVTTNLDRAVTAFQLRSGVVAFAQSESGQGGTDANGDGDAFDDVLHVHDAATGVSRNLGFAVEGFELDAEHLAFAVSELGQGGQDRNGDGDSSDLVLHLHDLAAGTTVNLATDATLGFKLDGGVLLAFGAWEPAQGATDLNGDGDVSDYALHVFDIRTGTLVNLEFDPSGGFQSFQLDGKFLTFGVQELAQGATDFNFDGDSSDIVLHLFDADTGLIENLGYDVTAGHQIRGGRLAFAVTEARQGMLDLNGDGDAGDVILHYADLRQDSARDRILALIARVSSLHLRPNVERNLVRFLERSLQALDRNQPRKTIHWLRVFQQVTKAYQGKKVPKADARELIAEAAAIIDLLEQATGGSPGHELCKKGKNGKHDKNDKQGQSGKQGKKGP